MNNMQPGDVIQVKTGFGLACVQCVCKNSDGIDVMRAFPIRDKRSNGLPDLVSGPAQFWFQTSGAALLKSKEFSKVGNVPIPDSLEIPLFRGDGDAPHAYVIGLDGVFKRIDHLTPEIRKLPLDIAIPAAQVIEKIETGWRPELDSTHRSGRRRLATPAETQARSPRRRLFFIAKEKDSADGLAAAFAARGFHPEVREGEKDWEVEAAFVSSSDMAENGKAEAACAALADKWGAQFLASEQEL